MKDIEKIALEKYPRIWEWNCDEKDWVDANYQIRNAYKRGRYDEMAMRQCPDIYHDNLLRRYNADKSLDDKSKRYEDI